MGETTHGFGGVAALEVPGGAVGASVEGDGVGGRKERKSGEGEGEGEDTRSEHHLAVAGEGEGELGEGRLDCSTWGVLIVFTLFLYVFWVSLTSSSSSFKGSGRCR